MNAVIAVPEAVEAACDRRPRWISGGGLLAVVGAMRLGPDVTLIAGATVLLTVIGEQYQEVRR